MTGLTEIGSTRGEACAFLIRFNRNIDLAWTFAAATASQTAQALDAVPSARRPKAAPRGALPWRRVLVARRYDHSKVVVPAIAPNR